MGEIFGLPWYTQNGPEITAAWRSALAELSPERVVAAVAHFRVAGSQYPPNLSVFLGAARALKLDRPEPKMLEKPRSMDVAARECLSMRQVLARSPVLRAWREGKNA